MRSVLFLAAFLALFGATLSFPQDSDEDALLEEIFRATEQGDDDGDGNKAEVEALNALVSAYSSVQEEDGDDGTAKTEGFISRVGKIFKTLKKIGTVLNKHFGHVPVVKKYSKYLSCLPTFQEQIELVTAQGDDDDGDLETALKNLEAQAQSEEDIAEVQFFKKLKRFGKKIWKKAKKIGGKALKVIRAVRNYLRCIKRSIEVQSEKEMKQVQKQAMHVLQNAITGRVVRL